MELTRRTSRAVALVAVVAMLAGGLAVSLQVLPPSTGAVLAGPAGGYLEEGARVAPLPGARSSFREADIVVAIAGHHLDGRGNVVAGATPTSDARVPAHIIRDGVERTLEVELTPYPLIEALVVNAGTLAFVVTLLALAAFVFLRRPRDPAAAGLLLLAVGAAASTPAFLLGIDPLAFARGWFPLLILVVVIVYHLLWAGAVHFALAFPRPRPLLVRRPALFLVPYVAIYGALAVAAGIALATSPGGLAAMGTFSTLGSLVTLVTLLVVAVIMGDAWRRSSGEERHMLHGIVLAGAFTIGASLVLWAVPEVTTGEPLLPWSVMAVIGLPLVLALAAAVLRHRAFDIDVVVRRSLVYGGMTGVVLAVYTLSAALLGTLIGGGGDYAVALLATALAALAALPARDLLQRAVDRALYGDRDEPVRAIRRLGERLTWTMDPAALPEVVVGTIADSLRLPFVALYVGEPPEEHLAAERGQAPVDEATLVDIPLVARSVVVGRLRLATRGPGEALSVADRRLLEDLARQAGPAVDTLALVEDLRRSRERIVMAREEERRRLRRDLHDGLGPTLAAIGMHSEAAASLLETDAMAARSVLAEVHDEVRAAVADVRRLVDGLRPPALDELGLVGAIRRQADRLGAADATFLVESPAPLEDLPAAVEVAAYRIAVEAMTNVVRHADARRCLIRLRTAQAGSSRHLALEVEDDGRGPGVSRDGAAARSRDVGVGLGSMRERAEEVGGAVHVVGLPEGGTLVRASLPLGSA
jgi:signal transduction histidine kinase